MKKIIVILMMIILVVSMTACDNMFSQTGATGGEDTIIITDSAGVDIEVPQNCESIICVWPSGTQLLVTLGMGDLLIGVSEDSKEQSWAVEMYPRLSEITSCSNDESAESIIGMNADIVLTTESSVAEEWRNKGITAITFNYYSIDAMKDTISTLSKIVPESYAEKCNLYLEYLEKNIQDVEEALAETVTTKENLYYIHGNSNKGLYKTAGGNTMNEEWANAAYVDFATSDLLTSSETVVDAEAILFANPTIIVIGGKYQHVLLEELKSSEEWADISAVKNNCIYTAPYGISPFDRFGAEFALMISWVATTVYSDLFSYDIHAEIKSFYSNFTGCELTDEQVDYIINGYGPTGEADI